MKKVFDDLNIFCHVVECGSLKQAADRLGMQHSTVSRRMDALEQSLGLTLLHRTTREVKVTERGLELFDECSPLLGSLQRSIDVAIDSEVQFKGRLNVSMPVRAGIDYLGDWLIDFASEHPELNLDISLSNTNKHLIHDDIDLAFRVGPLVDSSAIALKLWDIPYTLVASTALLERYGIGDDRLTMEDLQRLPCVVTRPATSWAFLDANRQEVMVEPNGQMFVDDLGLARHAVESGQYLGMLPRAMLPLDDAQCSLVELTLEQLTPRTRIMYAYYLGRRHTHSHIKRVVEYVKARYQAQ